MSTTDPRPLAERARQMRETLSSRMFRMEMHPAHFDVLDQADALLREQQAELERIKANANLEIHRLRFQAIALEEASDSLRRDLEVARVDAERYRWLRGDLCEDHSHRWTQWEVRCWKAPMWTDDLRREDLDAAIDLARARGEG